jgi:hypothetical protein
MLTSVVFLGFVAVIWGVCLWVGGAFLTAWAASERGRDPLGWFVLAFVFSPVVALLTLNALPEPVPLGELEREGADRVSARRLAGSEVVGRLA